MKRSKLGAAEQGRRARLQTSTVENIDTADPIAAAAQAKKAREGQYRRSTRVQEDCATVCVVKILFLPPEARIKAAAEAAAKAFAGQTKTVFYDNKGIISKHCWSVWLPIGTSADTDW